MRDGMTYSADIDGVGTVRDLQPWEIRGAQAAIADHARDEDEAARFAAMLGIEGK